MWTSWSVLYIVVYFISYVDATEWVSKDEFREKMEYLDQALNIIEKLTDDNRNMKLEIEGLKSQNTKLQEDNLSMKKDMADLKSALEDLKSANNDIKTTMNDLEYSVGILHPEDLAIEKQLEEVMESVDENSGSVSRNGNKDHSKTIFSKESRDGIEAEKSIDRRLIGAPAPDAQIVAFSAYITRKFDLHIGQNHVFVYDAVQSNVGNAYNNNSGIFTVPESGVYAFLWTIAAEGEKGSDGSYGEVNTELVVNSVSRAKIHADTEVEYDDAEATGFVILHVNANDLVFIRTINQPQGHLQLYIKNEWTFSGWKL